MSPPFPRTSHTHTFPSLFLFLSHVHPPAGRQHMNRDISQSPPHCLFSEAAAETLGFFTFTSSGKKNVPESE